MTAAKLADTSDPRFTDDQRATLARFEAAPAIPESWEATTRIVRRGVADAVEKVNCPTCGARPDRPCAIGFGKRLAKLPHPKRRAAARAATERRDAVTPSEVREAVARALYATAHRDCTFPAERLRAVLGPQVGGGRED